MRYDQYAEMEPCLLRPGKVRSSRTGAFVEPVFVRYREPKIHLDFRADVGFTKRQIYAFLEAQDIRYTTRVPANQVLRKRNGHLLTRPVRRPPRSRS